MSFFNFTHFHTLSKIITFKRVGKTTLIVSPSASFYHTIPEKKGSLSWSLLFAYYVSHVLFFAIREAATIYLRLHVLPSLHDSLIGKLPYHFIFGFLACGVYPFHSDRFRPASSLWHFYRLASVVSIRKQAQPSAYAARIYRFIRHKHYDHRRSCEHGLSSAFQTAIALVMQSLFILEDRLFQPG